MKKIKVELSDGHLRVFAETDYIEFEFNIDGGIVNISQFETHNRFSVRTLTKEFYFWDWGTVEIIYEDQANA